MGDYIIPFPLQTLNELVEMIELKARISLNFLNRHYKRHLEISFALKMKTTHPIEWSMVKPRFHKTNYDHDNDRFQAKTK